MHLFNFYKGSKMKNTLLLNTFLMAATALYAGNVYAQDAQPQEPAAEKEILFKIHDVKPNKNEEGYVKDCSYTLTVYNRSDMEIDSASLDLSWNDNDGNYLIEQDIVTDENGEKTFDGRMRISNKTISTFIDVPQVPTYSQVSVSATAKTEKCFLLLGNVNYRVTSCKLLKRDALGSAANAGSESCSKMFRFVPVTDPEYYKEFKPISYSAQVSAAEQQKIRDLEEIERTNAEILNNFDETRKIVNGIR